MYTSTFCTLKGDCERTLPLAAFRACERGIAPCVRPPTTSPSSPGMCALKDHCRLSTCAAWRGVSDRTGLRAIRPGKRTLRVVDSFPRNRAFFRHVLLLCALRFLTVPVVVLAGCGEQLHSTDPSGETERLPGDTLWMATVIGDGAAVAFTGMHGTIGLLDLDSGELKCRSTGIENTWDLQCIPESDRFSLAHGKWDASVPDGDNWCDRELAIVCPLTLSIEKRIRAPNGRRVGCWINRDTVMLSCCEKPADSGSTSHLTLCRVEGTELREVRTFRDLDDECVVSDVRRVSDHIVLLHLRVSNGGSETESLASELATLDVSNGRILHRVRTAIAADGGGRTRVARGGGYAIAGYSKDGIELRELPSLELSKKLVVDGESHSTAEMAVSKDGNYVAFGWSRLEVWDTRTGKIHLVDKLNEDIVNSDSFRVKGPQFPLTVAFAQQQYCLSRLEFVGDGHQLLAVTHDGYVALWDVSTRKCLLRKRVLEVEHLGTAGKHERVKEE